MSTIDPKNLTAQLAYRARGNPASTTAEVAISNCYPGLEFDMRNMWKRVLVGIVLHETRNVVIELEEFDASNPAPEELSDEARQMLPFLGGATLLGVEVVPEGGQRPPVAYVRFPRSQMPRDQELFNQSRAVERANGLAELVPFGGSQARCTFLLQPSVKETSSQLRPDLGGMFAIDGSRDPGSAWVSNAAGTDGTEAPSADGVERIVFDFGETRELGEMRLFTGTGPFFSIFPREFRIELSADEASWTEIYSSEMTPFDGVESQWWTVPRDHGDDWEARFVRIAIDRRQQLQNAFFAGIPEVVFDAKDVVELPIRRLFEPAVPGGDQVPVPTEQAARPGEFTQSLCSPWQLDFRDCVCHYWAASRPDFVNVDEESGEGHAWVNPARPTSGGVPEYQEIPADHPEVFENWDKADFFRIQFQGRDEEPPGP